MTIPITSRPRRSGFFQCCQKESGIAGQSNCVVDVVAVVVLVLVSSVGERGKKKGRGERSAGVPTPIVIGISGAKQSPEADHWLLFRRPLVVNFHWF